MVSAPAAIAAEQALAQQNVALSVVKKSAEAEQAIAGILEEALQSVPVNASRGANVNISA